jgi:hypothetical protein
MARRDDKKRPMCRKKCLEIGALSDPQPDCTHAATTDAAGEILFIGSSSLKQQPSPKVTRTYIRKTNEL